MLMRIEDIRCWTTFKDPENRNFYANPGMLRFLYQEAQHMVGINHAQKVAECGTISCVKEPSGSFITFYHVSLLGQASFICKDNYVYIEAAASVAHSMEDVEEHSFYAECPNSVRMLQVCVLIMKCLLCICSQLL